jgi:hypothetical protein
MVPHVRLRAARIVRQWLRHLLQSMHVLPHTQGNIQVTWSLIRRCIKRQRPGEFDLLDLTPVGHALLQTERQRKAYHPGYVLYWMRLPSWQWMRSFVREQYCWHQAVLFFHGRDGFELRWVAMYEQ